MYSKKTQKTKQKNLKMHIKPNVKSNCSNNDQNNDPTSRLPKFVSPMRTTYVAIAMGTLSLNQEKEHKDNST